MQVQYWGKVSIHCFTHLDYDRKPFLTMNTINPNNIFDNISLNIYSFYSQETAENVMNEFERKVAEYL